MPDCVVVLPGILGSELWLGDRLVWPGSALGALTRRYDRLEELLHPDLEARALIERVWRVPVYADLLQTLRALGFRDDARPATLAPFPYDWRRDARTSAERLAERLDELHAEHGGAVSFTLLGHSLGGLVARACLESGAHAARPGVAAVRRAVFLGVPHLGAPDALPGVLGWDRQAFLAPDQARVLASDPRYPAAYQLLPRRGQPCLWREVRGLPAADLYGADVAGSLGLADHGLAAARALQAVLDPARRPAEVRYFCFVGSRQRTTSVLGLAPGSGGGLTLRRERSPDAGDGTVPTWSALLPGVQARFVGGEHGRLFRDEELRRTLAALLERPLRVAAAPAPAVQLTVRPDVVSPGEALDVLLRFEDAARARGTLRVVRLDEAGEAAAPVRAEPIRPAGGAAGSLALELPAPAEPGAYRVLLAPDDGGPAAGEDLFVQAP